MPEDFKPITAHTNTLVAISPTKLTEAFIEGLAAKGKSFLVRDKTLKGPPY